MQTASSLYSLKYDDAKTYLVASLFIRQCFVATALPLASQWRNDMAADIFLHVNRSLQIWLASWTDYSYSIATCKFGPFRNAGGIDSAINSP